MAATAVWALWTTAEHVGSMARPTTDDNITVYDDAAVFCDSDTLRENPVVIHGASRRAVVTPPWLV